MRTLCKILAVLMVLVLVLPAQAQEQNVYHHIADAVEQAPETVQQIAVMSKQIRQPSKEEIADKWAEVTSSETIYAAKPSVQAPYAPGSLTEEFLETGITYLNYIRFVAGLPEVTLDDALNETSQYGAVLLAAKDELTHYPTKPADMDKAFFDKGYGATSSANISARWGYIDLTTMLKSALQGCVNDNNSLNNLSTAGHRRWLLNPTLGKVGFGYAESAEGWSYIVNQIHDRSGVGTDFTFISWPVAGNHPTNLFDKQNPWTVTLDTADYQNVSAKNLKITVTREADGKTWVLDSNTGTANYNQTTKYTTPYMIVNDQWYGLPNCIIFHLGTDAVEKYEGIFHVKITGLYNKKGEAVELKYDVDFFDIDSVSHKHNYTAVVTEATCSSQGYTTYTCAQCGDSYVGDYTGPVDHKYESGKCKWCDKEEYVVQWKAGSTSLNGTVDLTVSVVLSDNLVRDPSTVVRFRYADKTVDVPMAKAKEEWVNGVLRYRFSISMYAKQMTEKVTFQVYTDKGPVGKSRSYSIEEYCVNMLGKNPTPDSRRMYVALLNYGAAAQQRFNYNTANLANRSLSEADKKLSENIDVSAYKLSLTGSEPGIRAKSGSLILEDVVIIRVIYELEAGRKISDYTFTIDGKKVQPRHMEGNLWCVETEGIPAKDMDDIHTFVCGGITAKYGALSYVLSKLNSPDPLNVQIVKALYDYWYAAKILLG